MSLTITRCTDLEAWDAFVATSPQCTIFCKTLFLDVHGGNYDLWFAVKGGQPQAGAVVTLGESSPFMYQGLLFAGHSRTLQPHRRAKWTINVTEALLEGLSQRYDRLCFNLHHATGDLRGIQWFHYHEAALGQFNITLRYTGLIDLSAIVDFEEYLDTIRRNRKRDYRKAKSEGLIIEESKDFDTLDELHRLTFERQGIEQSSEGKRLLRAISEAALSKDFGKLLLCKNKQGETCSATLFLYDSDCGYSMFGATDPKFRSNGSYTYITLESIRRCKVLGLQSWDFLGINSPYRGDFKTSLNAVPKPYFEVEWTRQKF